MGSMLFPIVVALLATTFNGQVKGAVTPTTTNTVSDDINTKCHHKSCNKIAGTWLLHSATQSTADGISFPYGIDPQGWLIFTPAPDYTFIEEINARNLPPFPNGNVTAGTPSQWAEIVTMTQANAGVYHVDDNGDFVGQTTAASTFPNFVNVTTSLEKLSLTVNGDDLLEKFELGEGAVLQVVWKKFMSSGVKVS